MEHHRMLLLSISNQLVRCLLGLTAVLVRRDLRARVESSQLGLGVSLVGVQGVVPVTVEFVSGDRDVADVFTLRDSRVIHMQAYKNPAAVPE
jgi:hypothetical protein